MMTPGEIALYDILADRLSSQDAVEEVLLLLRQGGWAVYRKKVVVNPRRPVVSKPVTPAMRRQIIDLHNKTDLTQHQIAEIVGTNVGRVNEVLH